MIEFRRLFATNDTTPTDEAIRLTRNFRPTQNVNNRVIQSSFRVDSHAFGLYQERLPLLVLIATIVGFIGLF